MPQFSEKLPVKTAKNMKKCMNHMTVGNTTFRRCAEIVRNVFFSIGEILSVFPMERVYQGSIQRELCCLPWESSLLVQEEYQLSESYIWRSGLS